VRLYDEKMELIFIKNKEKIKSLEAYCVKKKDTKKIRR